MHLSRRTLISAVAAPGVAWVLAACGDEQDADSPDAAAGVLVQRFATEVLVPGTVRLPMSLAVDGTLQPSGPPTLTASVADIDGRPIGQPVVAQRRDRDLVTAYWDFRVELDTPGVYRLVLDGGDPDGALFQVNDPASVPMPYVGSVLPALDTPTVQDPRGVTPYCSLSPAPCPLHDITWRDALAASMDDGLPLVLIVGTPAHCQTGTCAPGLQFLVAEHEARGSAVRMVHVDVFADEAGTIIAPTVEQLGLSYEPVLYLCAPDGTIVEQLDAIWGPDELAEALDRLEAGSAAGVS